MHSHTLKITRSLAILFGVGLSVSHAFGADLPPPNTGASLFQVIMGLLVVLAFVIFMGWLVKRFNLQPLQSQAVAKIVGGVSVGQRERVIVVEIADQWIVVGVAPGQVNALATLEKGLTPPQAPTASQGNPFKQWLSMATQQQNSPQK